MARRALALAAAVVLTVAAWTVVVAPSPPAAAAACGGSTGVTVVVDYQSLGGGVQGTCVKSAGLASDLFPKARFPLTYAQRQPGFVCRVAGKPAADPCVTTSPADAYWGLWWSNGRTGRWTYSSLGVGSLDVPDGGYVALAWDDVPGQARPSYDPVARASAPTTSPAPTRDPEPEPETETETSEPPSEPPATTPTAAPTPSPTPSRPTPTSTPTPPTATPTSPTPTTSATPEAPPTLAEPSAPSDPTSATSGDSAGGSLPWWVPVLVIALLLVAGVGAVLARRRRPQG
ncbi:hypothetical protein ABFT23_15025 [Nocardioides sp. C4-1]|uniref:hypothetical protein n=1 Tax=Nocardioides sp. C4-1 TaxID=3151851 RepID=UPI0032652626